MSQPTISAPVLVRPNVSTSAAAVIAFRSLDANPVKLTKKHVAEVASNQNELTKLRQQQQQQQTPTNTTANPFTTSHGNTQIYGDN